MEIPEKCPLQVPSSQNRPVEEIPQPSVAGAGMQPHKTAKDTVSLTERGREFNAAVKHARTLPEIREDRVMQIKRRLEEGTYRIVGHRIAANMLDETMENNTVLKHIDTHA
ncbi:flagellar biosynthesis anti-sigma factor FlgM [Desulfosarcina sp.]|uniref:flagellar biosynthesis anti-sigma factor FlgM n=1 Tax=Desulfosarcina sp. TaxID=2027861 RepID=UPI003970F2DC